MPEAGQTVRDLPPLTADEWAVARWVAVRAAALDDSPTRRTWRYHALGRTTLEEAVASAPADARLGLKLPVVELRVIRRVAQSRGLGVYAYVRRAIGTVLAACDDIDAPEIPFLLHGGLIRPVGPPPGERKGG